MRMIVSLISNINLFLTFFSNIFIYVDLIQSAWTQNNQTGQKMRTLSFTVSLTQAIGPRTCQVTETQVKKNSVSVTNYTKCLYSLCFIFFLNPKLYYAGDVTVQ